MKFSASELVKRSAAQLIYKEIKKLEWKVTPGQYEGEKYSEEIVQKNEASSEKRGILNLGDDLLFFCIDMVKDNKFIEIKIVKDQDEYEQWYLNISVIQSTLYASLLSMVKNLDTPIFMKKKGYKQEIITVPQNFVFELWFGTEQYSIKPNENILNHYLNKLKVIKSGVENRDFDPARKFDAKFKHKEYDIYKPSYKLINSQILVS